MRVSLEEVLRATGGRVLNRKETAMFSGVSTDSRRLRSGELFVALAGEHFDGHRFIPAAFKKGAGGAVVHSAVPGRVPGPVIKVKDTLTALGDLAGFWRDRHDIPLAAITGSNGKTTTKEILASILTHAGYRVLKTEGNFNNLIGVPLMLFKLTGSYEMAVLELGTSRFGEIRRLTEISRPRVGVITMIGGAHLEYFKNIGGVARAKGELLERLGPDEKAVLNADDPYTMSLVKKCRAEKVFFGFGKTAHVRCLSVEEGRGLRSRADREGWGSTIEMDVFGRRMKAYSPLPGMHNITNVLAAVGGASALDGTISLSAIQKGLVNVRMPPGRFQIMTKRGVHIIDDSYNANPRSMEAALRCLRRLCGGSARSVAILGDMLELGAFECGAHRDIGRLASTLGLDLVIAVGKNARNIRDGALSDRRPRGTPEGREAEERVRIARGHDEAVSLARDFLRKGDWVLVKGSRGMKMDGIVKGLGG